MSKINVGIAGFGLSGAVFHAPLLSADGHFVIKAVATSRHDQVARQYSGVRVVDSYSELIEDSEIELIRLFTLTI